MYKEEWYESHFVVLGGAIIVTFLLVGTVGFIMNMLNGNHCVETAKLMGFKQSFSFQTGCMIEVRGQMIPIRSYRVIE